MRPLISTIVPELTKPDEAVLDAARRTPPSAALHAEFIQRLAAFHEIESRPPAHKKDWSACLKLAALNAERLKDPAAVRALLDRAGADVALISEADVGMARSGNRHTIRALTAKTGEAYCYGVEFVELDLGDPQEIREHKGERNAIGLHGNAIVSALPLADIHLIPLEESGFWFPGREGAQRRIGGRIALAARIAAAPKPLWVVAVHLESKTDPTDRQEQVRALLNALDSLTRGEACVIGGDFNTKALPSENEAMASLLERPERFEPLFRDLAEAGFGWRAANIPLPTQRTGPAGKPRPPFGKLDWFFTRGVKAGNPQVVPALDGKGRPVSDHEMLTVEIGLSI